MQARVKFIHRIAAVSGCSAVALGAIGAHKVKPVTQTHQYESYTTANRYHFYHTMGLFKAQFSSYPLLTAGFFGIGMFMFCSAAYCEGLTELPDLEGASWAEYMKRTKDEHKFVFLMPVGGTCFMLGWLSHIL